MDEAHLLGRGKYFDIHGNVNRVDILLAHLNRVCDIADKYNFEPMMWSDMFYRLANGGAYYAESSKFDESIKEKIPQKLTIVYWDYYNLNKKTYDRMIKGHKQLSDKIAFGGGAWKWSGFAPHNYFSNKTTKLAIRACLDGGIKDVFMTMWGDNGAETSKRAVYPALFHAAQIAQGIDDVAVMNENFKNIFGLFQSFFIKHKLRKTFGVSPPRFCRMSFL